MRILQLRMTSLEDVEKDIISVATDIDELWETLEETGFMNPRRKFYFQKILFELDKIVEEVKHEKSTQYK